MSEKKIIYASPDNDDTDAIEAFLNGEPVFWPDGKQAGDEIYDHLFYVTRLTEYTGKQLREGIHIPDKHIRATFFIPKHKP